MKLILFNTTKVGTEKVFIYRHENCDCVDYGSWQTSLFLESKTSDEMFANHCARVFQGHVVAKILAN